MPYAVKSNKNGTTCYLHSTKTEARSGLRTRPYWDRQSIHAPKTIAPDYLPDGYVTPESARTGQTLLKQAA
jgi:hypothetical protein